MINAQQLKTITDGLLEAVDKLANAEETIFVHVIGEQTQYTVLHAHSLGDVPQVGDTLQLRVRGEEVRTYFLKVTGRELNMVQDGDMKPGRVSTVTLWVEKEQSQ